MMVDALVFDNQRLGKLLFDLVRLDEALVQAGGDSRE